MVGPATLSISNVLFFPPVSKGKIKWAAESTSQHVSYPTVFKRRLWRRRRNIQHVSMINPGKEGGVRRYQQRRNPVIEWNEVGLRDEWWKGSKWSVLSIFIRLNRSHSRLGDEAAGSWGGAEPSRQPFGWVFDSNMVIEPQHSLQQCTTGETAVLNQTSVFSSDWVFFF